MESHVFRFLMVLLMLLLILGAFFMGRDTCNSQWIPCTLESGLNSGGGRNATQPVLRVPDLKPVPSNTRVSSYFGLRLHPVFKMKRMHWGIDFPIPTGTPVRASAAGVIEKIVWGAKQSSYGKHIRIGHDEVYSTLYAHLSKISVNEGQYVEKGDTIGLSGNTGISTNPHLHFEVFKDGKRVNPIKFLQKK